MKDIIKSLILENIVKLLIQVFMSNSSLDKIEHIQEIIAEIKDKNWMEVRIDSIVPPNLLLPGLPATIGDLIQSIKKQ